jgi:MoaA/NifB/PqqE/SkfB family radical SAM enzyme
MSLTFNKESFCPEVWNQLEINMAGDFSLCCLANYDKEFGMALDTNGNQMNILTHSFEEAINSAIHKEHRLQLSRNEKPLRCRNCYDSEESTRNLRGNLREQKGMSKRQRVLANMPGYVNVHSASDVTHTDGSVNSKIVNLHIRFGNLCNLKCLQCNPQSSSLWTDDWLALNKSNGINTPVFKLGKTEYEIVADQYGRNKLAFPNWWETDIWWEKFKQIMPQLKYIYFTGGEPFLVPAMDKCLDLLIEADLAKDIILRFDTNLSVINDKILNRLSKFKDVKLCVSIDEVDNRYEFIRYPGKFEKFVLNLESVIERNIPVEYISTCIGIATIFTVPRVNSFAKKYKLTSTFRFLENPHWLDIRYLPTSAKDDIIEFYNKENEVEIDPNFIKYNTAVIKLLTKYKDSSYTDYTKLNEFVNNMDKLDKLRGTNWRIILPDVYNLLIKNCKNNILSL